MATGLYYAELLGRFAAFFFVYLTKKKVLFHLDNALAHTSALATVKYEPLPHSPYSLDFISVSLLEN